MTDPRPSGPKPSELQSPDSSDPTPFSPAALPATLPEPILPDPVLSDAAVFAEPPFAVPAAGAMPDARRPDGAPGQAAAGAAPEAQRLAQRVGEGMFANDAAARGLGMTIERIGPGRALLTMRVRDEMLNGFRICHGGFIATLADTAFAYACNSRNALTVASGLSIDFVSPGRPGELLAADAQEVSLAGRTGLYDVRVTGEDGRLIAVMRGRSYRTKDRVVPNEEQ